MWILKAFFGNIGFELDNEIAVSSANIYMDERSLGGRYGSFYVSVRNFCPVDDYMLRVNAAFSRFMPRPNRQIAPDSSLILSGKVFGLFFVG